MTAVVHDYFYASPCLRDIELTYGPDARTARAGDGQHWRSKYYQAHDRYETLKKETSRRKSIHEELEAAFMDDPDSIPAKVQEFNKTMIEHFNLRSADNISNRHVTWLAKQLSEARQDKCVP